MVVECWRGQGQRSEAWWGQDLGVLRSSSSSGPVEGAGPGGDRPGRGGGFLQRSGGLDMQGSQFPNQVLSPCPCSGRAEP